MTPDYRRLLVEVEQEVGTYERILEGALHALARPRPSGISMTEVARRAGVARGTVYRHFEDKHSLLVALAEYERRRFDGSLRAAVRDVPPGPQRIVTLVEFTRSYFDDHPSLGQLLEIEPSFVLDNLRARLPVLEDTAAEFLGPIVAEAPLVQRGVLSGRQLSDLLIRLLLSLFLLPASDAEGVARAIHGLVEELVPLPPQ